MKLLESMKRRTAIKLVRKCVDYYIQKRLAFDASMYEKGVNVSEYAERCYREREKINEAFNELSKQDTLL